MFALWLMQCCTRLYDLNLLQLTEVKSVRSLKSKGQLGSTNCAAGVNCVDECVWQWASAHSHSLLLSRGADVTTQNSQVCQPPQCMVFACASFVQTGPDATVLQGLGVQPAVKNH